MSSGELTDKMKYHAMRAKKMTARVKKDEDLPTPSQLVEKFSAKKTEISLSEAREIMKEVKRHRKEVGVGKTRSGSRSKSKAKATVGKPTLSAPRSSKPAPKKEVSSAGSATANRQSYSRSYGIK